MSEEDASSNYETEDLIFARLHRRIRGARARPAKRSSSESHWIGKEERYWSRHLADLVNETFALGIARRYGLEPFGGILHDVYKHVMPMSLGYIQLAGYVNDLALREWTPSSDRTSPKFHALIELHGRALVLLEEIMLLTFYGYPSGASALSRTLHEVRVTARLLERFEARLSERYLASHIVDLWHARADYMPPGAAGRSRAWKETEAELHRRFTDVVSKHGESMLVPNGWAWPRLQGRYGNSQKLPRHIAFSQLHSAAGIRYDRQRYRTSSHRVHGGHLGGIATLMSYETGVALLGPRPFRLDVAAVEAITDAQRVTESLLRTCGKFVHDGNIYYWLEALDQVSFVLVGLFGDAQDTLDYIFERPE